MPENATNEVSSYADEIRPIRSAHPAPGRVRSFLSAAIIIALLALASLLPSCAQGRVVVVPIHDNLDGGKADFAIQCLNDAWRSGDSAVILDLDTTSGDDDAAARIKSAVIDCPVPVAAFVHDHALGPGSLVAVSCKTIAMSPGATLGDAPNSTLKLDLSAAAEASGRNPAIASGFAGANTPLPQVGAMASGSPVTLTAKSAQSVGYCDVVAQDYSAILAKMGIANAAVVEQQYNPWLSWAAWIVQPWVTILLLAIGLALVVLELLTWHSAGIAGVIGGVVIAVIFAAHIAVGHASWIGVILVVAGIALLLFETHLFPGHGVSAFIGMILIAVGIFYALGGIESGALFSMFGSLLATVGILICFFIYLPRSGVWKRIGQPMQQSAYDGYVSSEDFTPLLGSVGIAASGLRPSGTADFEGIRVPVVSEGAFVEAGSVVQVVMVQGGRIVVKQEPSTRV